MINRPKTIICDIDGTLIKHHGSLTKQMQCDPEILPGTIEKISEWDSKGYHIILITGRKESMRKITEQQLSSLGIVYDKLVMGVTSGERILINDNKPTGEKTAFAICVERNIGLHGIDV